MALARVDRVRRLAAAAEAVPAPSLTGDRAGARAIVERALQRGGGWLTPDDAQALLSAVGFPRQPVTAPRVRTPVVAATDRIGYPVALKPSARDPPQDRSRRRAAAAAHGRRCAKRVARSDTPARRRNDGRARAGNGTGRDRDARRRRGRSDVRPGPRVRDRRHAGRAGGRHAVPAASAQRAARRRR